MARSQTLFIAMNGEWVGTLTRRRFGLEFQYDKEWLDKVAIPLSSSLQLSEQPHKGTAVDAYFDNLLPDRPDTRQRLMDSLGADSIEPFDLLAIAGRDCVGAVQLLQSREELGSPSDINGVPLTDEEISLILKSASSSPLGASSDEEFRISVAGAQDKTALLRHNDQWMRPLGSTPTTHIIKPPIEMGRWSDIQLHDSVENEWVCLELCREFGLSAAEAEITTFAETKALVVTRFDRRWREGGILRIPQEDACQSYGVPSAKKYESKGGPGIPEIMERLLAARDPEQDRYMFFRAVIFYWLLAATDGHAKNFSFFLLRHGRLRLTPLYDVLSVYPVVARGELSLQKIKMAMAVKGTMNRKYRWRDIFPRHWLTTAESCGFPQNKAQEILEGFASETEKVIEGVASRLPPGFPAAVSEPIFEHLSTQAKRLC